MDDVYAANKKLAKEIERLREDAERWRRIEQERFDDPYQSLVSAYDAAKDISNDLPD